MLLELDNVDVAYHQTPIVKAVSFRLEQGKIGCLLGPSGCGKTTLLRSIAGFEPVVGGTISLGGERVSRPGQVLAPEKRGVGMVFQDFALFPHLTIADNIAFGIRRWSRREQQARVVELLELVGLPSYGKSYPHQLSGGQQQRVALARAMAPRPKLLLMDEPFSSMDVELREALAREVRSILKKEKITAMLVTHDQHEAFAMADEIGVMEAGRIAQWDTGYNLYHKPADRFVADFIGQGVLLKGEVLNTNQVKTPIGVLEGKVPIYCREGCPVEVLIRPDDVADCKELCDVCGGVDATVTDRAFRGAEFLYTLKLESGESILCLTHSHNYYEVGEPFKVKPTVDHVVVFASEGPPPQDPRTE